MLDSGKQGGPSLPTALELADCLAGGDEVTLPAMLPVLSHTPGATRWAGPDLGHHTEQILSQELKLSVEAIEALRIAKAI